MRSPMWEVKTEALADIEKISDKWKRLQNEYEFNDKEMEIAQYIIGKMESMSFLIRNDITNWDD